MPKKEIRIYSLEVIADEHVYFQESFIDRLDTDASLEAVRVCRNIIRSWQDAEFEDSRDIVIRFISSKQKV
jgi:hypothetical protein